jgi:hypothetical protein
VVNAFANWLHATTLGWAVSGGVPWLEPACKTLHFVGLVLLVGGAGVVDLRLLGVAQQLPLRPLSRLMRVAALGFVINLLTGIAFFAGSPFQYLENVAFWLKMLFIACAGVNVLVFYASGLGRTVDGLGAGESAPLAARLAAVASLFLWIGVMYWGRMLAGPDARVHRQCVLKMV